MYIPDKGCGKHQSTRNDCPDCKTYLAQRILSERPKVPTPRKKEKIVLAKMFPRIFAPEPRA